MIEEDKSMFAGCIDKMAARSCGSCPDRDDCSFVLPEAFGFVLSSLRCPSISRRPTKRPFFEFLDEVAKGIERNRAPRAPRTTPFRREVEHHLETVLASGPQSMWKSASLSTAYFAARPPCSK